MQIIETLTEVIGEYKIVDLSNDVTQHVRGPFETRIDVLEAEPGAQFFIDQVLPQLLPGDMIDHFQAKDFPNAAFLRHEQVTASVHAGSHIDAPGHYGSGVAAKEDFINAAPLEIFMRPGVLYDAVGVVDPIVMQEHIDVIGREKGITDVGTKIVLIRTGGDKAISATVVSSLLDAGVNVIGTDSESFDGPFQQMMDAYLKTRDTSLLWPCHMLGRHRPYYQLERLSGLDRLPPTGFFVLALPVLIEGATAAWTRAIALVPESGD